MAGVLGFLCSAPVDAPAAERDPLFAAAHPQAPVLVLSDHVRVFAHYDSDRAGISGTHTREIVYWIRDRRGRDEVNRQFRWTSPRWTAEKFEIEIESTDGSTRHTDGDDLDWIPVSDADGSVYRLDSEAAYTVVQGLRTGDLLRVRSRHRIRGLHGLRQVEWGGAANLPVARRRLDLAYPDDHTLTVGIRAPEVVAGHLDTTDSGDDGTQSRTIVVDASGPDGDPLVAHGGELVITPHFVAVGDDLPKTVFAAGPDWEAVARGYARRVDSHLVADEALARTARAIVDGVDDERTRVELLYRHVQETCRYLGLFDGLGGILPRPASETARKGFGDCKGLSALLIAMCRAVGIDAHPVLVRTRRSGPLDPGVPNLVQFDHFIAWADVAGGLWLDPTYDFCPAGLVPTANAASPVLLLHPDRPGLVEIGTDRARAGSLDYVIKAEIDAHGAMDAVVTETATDTAGLYRRINLADTEVDARVLARAVMNRSLARSVVAMRPTEAGWGQPTVTELHFAADRAGTKAGDILYLPRALVRVPREVTGFSDRSARGDLRFVADRSERWAVALPLGASVEPDSSRVEAPGLTWTYRVRLRRATMLVEREYRWDRRELATGELEDLEAAIDRIVEAEQGYLTIQMPAER